MKTSTTFDEAQNESKGTTAQSETIASKDALGSSASGWCDFDQGYLTAPVMEVRSTMLETDGQMVRCFYSGFTGADGRGRDER
ncbi:gfo/Idh/MocA family oxidoreductase [Sesbania bispinosa]|nr:gfo/Idh/MocA family oxidoreductase [Sesbania bispinosa]